MLKSNDAPATLDTPRTGQDGESAALEALQDLLERHRPFLILSPPRSASTALARALSNHSQIGPYIHEPCDRYRHEDAGIGAIVDRLQTGGLEGGALIKEMTFQLRSGRLAEVFLQQVRHPIAVLIRHPRRTLESRLRKVLQGLIRPESSTKMSITDVHRIRDAVQSKNYSSIGDLIEEQVFPLEFTGWQDLERQLEICTRNQIPYRVIDAARFRAEPRANLEPLLAAWGLTFEPAMLEWDEGSFQVQGLNEQSSWYRRVKTSRGVLPETASLPGLEHFPERFHKPLKNFEKLYFLLRNDTFR